MLNPKLLLRDRLLLACFSPVKSGATVATALSLQIDASLTRGRGYRIVSRSINKLDGYMLPSATRKNNGVADRESRCHGVSLGQSSGPAPGASSGLVQPINLKASCAQDNRCPHRGGFDLPVVACTITHAGQAMPSASMFRHSRDASDHRR